MGFILALLLVILLVLPLRPKSDLAGWIYYTVIILSPIVGFILSTAGLVTSKKRGKTGKGFGIAGIVISSIYAVIIGIVALFGYLMIWSLSPRETDKTLTTFYSDSKVVAVRYYYRGQDGYRFEELDEEKLDEFISDLDSMELKTGGMVNMIHSYGIEMELDDGTYLIYDCTELEHTGTPFDKKESRYDSIEDRYLEDSGKDFWDRIEEYFPGMEEYDFSYGW